MMMGPMLRPDFSPWRVRRLVSWVPIYDVDFREDEDGAVTMVRRQRESRYLWEECERFIGDPRSLRDVDFVGSAVYAAYHAMRFITRGSDEP